jgi:hypothetical protein
MKLNAIKYSIVESWLLDCDQNEIDQRQHGFTISSQVTSEERVALISNALGTRMWCDIDSEYVKEDDYLPILYDSTHSI